MYTTHRVQSQWECTYLITTMHGGYNNFAANSVRGWVGVERESVKAWHLSFRQASFETVFHSIKSVHVMWYTTTAVIPFMEVQ